MEAAAFQSSSLAIPFPSSCRDGSPAAVHYLRLPCRRRCRSPHLRLRASSTTDRYLDSRVDPVPVEVIAIGSRKDAVIDSCLDSSSSSRFRFWTIHSRDSQNLQLLQRHHGTDVVLMNMEFPLLLHPCPPAIILVASAGHGLDHITGAELLSSVKSEGGLAVAIVLKPFSFEGQRRHEEVDAMVKELRDCTQFYIVVEADSLLKTEVETLAEGLESANNAVFLAVNAISIMMSMTHMKFLNTPDEQIQEIKPMEVLKLLGSYGEAKVGFGAGYNVKAAIVQSVFHCPFLSDDIKDINGPVFFTLTSACTMDKSDLLAVPLTFRRITAYNGEIIFSKLHEPDLEPNLVVTTLLVMGSRCNEKKDYRKWNFFPGLAQRFPFISSLLGRDFQQPTSNLPLNFPGKSSVDVSSGIRTLSSSDLVNGALKSISAYFGKVEAQESIKESSYGNKRSKVDTSFSRESFTGCNNQNSEAPSVQRVEPISWSIGPGFQIAQLWSKERTTLMETINNEKLDNFTLPVGVKASMICSDRSSYVDFTLSETSDRPIGESLGTTDLPSMETNAGLDSKMNIYNSARTLLKGRNVDESRKRGLLSVRAATMMLKETHKGVGHLPWRCNIGKEYTVGDVKEAFRKERDV